MKYVLIVDDDQDLLDMVCLMVLSHGMNPICVSSGDAALKELEKNNFDLILMDIFLGNYDGRALARRFKSDPKLRSVPILLYSAGQITPHSLQESLADGFLQKPFEMKQLISRMQEMMAA